MGERKMKIIRNKELSIQDRPDGRTVTRILQQETGMKFSSFQMLYVTHPPNLREGLHAHEISYEALYFLDQANYIVNGEHYQLNERDLLLLEPGDVHGAIPIGREVRILVFQIPAITDDKKVRE